MELKGISGFTNPSKKERYVYYDFLCTAFEGQVRGNAHEGEQKWWLSTDTVGTIDNTGKFSATGLGSTWIYFSQKEDIPHDSIQIDVVDLKKVVIDIEGNASTVSNDSINMILGETIYIETQCEDSRGESLNGTETVTFTKNSDGPPLIRRLELSTTVLSTVKK